MFALGSVLDSQGTVRTTMVSKTEKKAQKKARADASATTSSGGRRHYGYATGAGVEDDDRVQAEADDASASGVGQGAECGTAVRGAEAISEESEAEGLQVQRRADPPLGGGHARLGV